MLTSEIFLIPVEKWKKSIKWLKSYISKKSLGTNFTNIIDLKRRATRWQ